jgi:two-component system response regulator
MPTVAATHTILLVEDNPDHVLLALDALEEGLRDDVSVHVVSDGGAALEYLYAPDTASPALILLDIQLPVTDGFQVLSRIKSDDRLKVIPVVMLTSSSDARDVGRSYGLGSNSFVSKPFGADDLHERLGQIPSYWLDVNTPPEVVES